MFYLMPKCPLYRRSPRNILSYGPETEPITLENLNILIGPNGSGKSNLIETISLLRATTGDVRTVIRQGGGTNEWIWKGNPKGTASIDAVISNPKGAQPLRHVFSFREEKQSFRLDDERIENQHPDKDKDTPYFYYRYQKGYPVLNVNGDQRSLKQETVEPDLYSRPAPRPRDISEVSYLAGAYDKIRIFREWTLGAMQFS